MQTLNCSFVSIVFGFAKEQMWFGSILKEVDIRMHWNNAVDDTHVADKHRNYFLPQESSVSHVQHTLCRCVYLVSVETQVESPQLLISFFFFFLQ